MRPADAELDPEVECRVRCEKAGVVYLAPGDHPSDKNKLEVTSTVEATRQSWTKKRLKLLAIQTARSGLAQKALPSLAPGTLVPLVVTAAS